MSTQIAKSQQNPVLQLLEAKKGSFASVLPKHISPDSFMRKALFACSKNPSLMQCSPLSLVSAFLQAAQLGCDPTGLLGEGYIIPYKGEATFQIGYAGMISLARRSGELASIRARAVYDGDKFRVAYGLSEELEHVPALEADHDIGTLRFVYCVIELKDGGHVFEVMSKADVDRIRASSRAGNSGPWVTWYEQMALKSVIKRTLKLVPKSAELAKTLETEAAFEHGDSDPVAFELGVVEATMSKTDKIKEALADSRAPGQEG